MKFSLGAAGEVDLATTDEIRKMLSESSPVYPAIPTMPARYRSDQVSAVAVGGVALLKFERPKTGRQFNVRNLLVTGADDHTVVAGSSVAIYLGDTGALSGQGAVSFPLGMLYQPGVQTDGTLATIPWSNQFGSKQLVVGPAQDLFLNVQGAGTSPLTGVIWFWDEPISDLEYT
jgi:hypothetical protein